MEETPMEVTTAYPVTLAIDYPERQSRWKTLLRLFLALPVLVFAAILTGGAFQFQQWTDGRGASLSIGAAGAVVLAIWIAIVVHGRIPRWLFDFEVALMRFQVRVYSYLALLTDTYPPFEGDYPVRLEVQYPQKLTRWKVLIWKAFTAIPHFAVLLFLSIGAVFSVIIAWFAILITGRFPQGLHGYVAGVVRWSMRVQAYGFSLTDEYPPFSLSSEAGPAGRDTYVVSSVMGWLLGAGFIAFFVAAVIAMQETVRIDVSYDDLTAGRVDSYETMVEIWNVDVALTAAMDPADESFPLLMAEEDKRLVAFQLTLDNDSSRKAGVRRSNFSLKDSDGDWHDPLLVVVGGRVAPIRIEGGSTADATLIFEIDEPLDPVELRYSPDFTVGKRIIYELE